MLSVGRRSVKGVKPRSPVWHFWPSPHFRRADCVASRPLLAVLRYFLCMGGRSVKAVKLCPPSIFGRHRMPPCRLCRVKAYFSLIILVLVCRGGGQLRRSNRCLVFSIFGRHRMLPCRLYRVKASFNVIVLVCREAVSPGGQTVVSYVAFLAVTACRRADCVPSLFSLCFPV